MTIQQRFVRRLVIGVGNQFRGDDAAGLAVVLQLRDDLPVGTLTREETGDAAGLIESWQGFDDVVIVDACSSGRPPGSLFRFDAGTGPIPEGILRGCSTHTMGIGTVIEMARTLKRMPARLTVFAIEGTDFTVGAPISPRVLESVTELVRQLRHDWSSAPLGRLT